MAPHLLNALLLLLATGAVTSGPQSARKIFNITGVPTPRPERSCLLAEFSSTALCYHSNLTTSCLDLENCTSLHIVCERGISTEWLKGQHPQVMLLTLLDWPGGCVNVAPLQFHFPQLLSLELHRSQTLSTFKGHFTSNCTIEKLVMRELRALHELPPGLVSQMRRLRELDLRRNALRHLRARTVRQPPRLTTVLLTDNGWDCSDGGLDWLAMEGRNGTARRRIADYYRLMCHQRLYRGKPLHIVMDIIRTVSLTCPEPCACNMTHVVTDPAGVIVPLITVDCASRALVAPPPSLPPNTTTLRLQGNQIDTISVMVQNPHYRRLSDLYLDNNTITSIKELEGSEWLTTFRVLSLRGNTLTQVPTYVLDNAFQRNPNIVKVYLGHNPWRCDCQYTPKFQDFVLKYASVIRDLPDIKCSRSDDKDISMVQISSISIADICREADAMFMRPVDILNVVLATLIVLVLGRFCYDCYSFKTTGKLPWISSILP